MTATLRCDGITEGTRVLTNAGIAGHHGHELRLCAKHLDTREMDRVERPDRLDRERPSGACEDILGHGDDIAASSEALEAPQHSALVLWCYAVRQPGAKHRSVCFC